MFFRYYFLYFLVPMLFLLLPGCSGSMVYESITGSSVQSSLAIKWDETPPSSHDIAIDSFAQFSALESSDVMESYCQVNSQGLPCKVGQRFQMEHLISGKNEIIVNVFDQAGNESTLNYQWEVYTLYRELNQSVLVQQGKIDVLFVVDNSQSMTKEQKNLSRRLHYFLYNLLGLNWRVAVTIDKF